MNHNIAVFGAFDINSLGDMLFPKALEIEFGKRMDVANLILFSPTNTRSEYGNDYRIYPYEEFERIHAEYSFDAIIIGGGELLHCRDIQFTNMRGAPITYQNGKIWRFPVEMGKKHDIKTLINSVGMPYDISAADKKLLETLVYVSFRDKYSLYRFLGKVDDECNNLVPDSLWNLDDYFPIITTPNATEYASKITGLAEGSKYVALQLGTLDNWKNIYECVLEYCRENHLKLVVLAVNWCHDDKAVIHEIAEIKDPDCYVAKRILQIEEIMSIIAGAEMLVCTSLHGSIIGCLSGVNVIVYNMYSHFVSKMDGLADWLECRNLLVDNVRQLKTALANTSDAEQKFPIAEIKKRLAKHFDQMAQVILGIKGNDDRGQRKLSDKALNLDRSFFEWRNASGKFAWRTVISTSTSDTYQINENFDHDGEVLWAFKTMEFLTIHVDSFNMKSSDVDESGRCYSRTAQFAIKSDKREVSFCYRKIIEEQTDVFHNLLQLYWNKAAHVELLEEAERSYICEIRESEKTIAALRNENASLLKQNDTLKKENLYIRQKLSSTEENVTTLYYENEALSKENNALKVINTTELTTNTQIKNELECLETENLQLKDTIKEQQSTINNMAQTAADTHQIILNKEGHIEQLLEVEREYEREKHSRTYRMALVFRKISTFFLPANSKRRFFCKLLVKGVRHPILMIRMINLRRIKNCFTILRTEGTDSASLHLQLVEEFERSGSVESTREKLDIAQVAETQEQSHTLDDYMPLTFTVPAKPLVSIIIPAYNQFDYTYHCLESIQKHSGSVTYEILLADDCSTDLTKDVEKIVTGILTIRNQNNLRFLLNCNHAAEQARGKYILFLNNDTQVQENWLQPLVDLMESDSSIGMTGSKLIYADGHLQEAGGIFWKDASAWNYGHMQNPEDPEYNYVKEADYISGASIMIRRSLWEEIGGFDQRFAPAYYEDSDLAFEVRKHGYKVVYQPLSAVVHFEGISNGTDVTTGQKKYQVVNQQKFYEKWKDVLEKEHFPNGENVFLAKDRSRHKKQILVVDHYVPHYDKDAGGKCTYMYLLLFVRMGLKVTFIGDNFYKHEPYTTDLNQHGIEVLYGNYYFNNWEEWLRNNLHYFDYVYLQRPHISIKYIDLVKQYGHAKIFYFAHDLHHVREYREYLLTHDEGKLKSSEHWKQIEYELFEKADVGHVVGSYEQEIMQKAFPGKPIRNIPLYIYEETLTGVNKNFKERHDLIYVGGFGHPPNIDAVLWFGKEVFPKVIEKCPEIKWHVVGGKVPEEVQALASNNIIIHGFLSDEELHKLYHQCRMAVVPLRVGAGVKGKVVEAAYYQIPLITTTIGAEGLDDTIGNMMVEDNADRMAETICNLYGSYEQLSRMSNAGKTFIERYFIIEEASRVVEQDL